MVTASSRELPLRNTVSVLLVPGLVVATERDRSLGVSMALSPYLVMMSPSRTPALSAAEPATTLFTERAARLAEADGFGHVLRGPRRCATPISPRETRPSRAQLVADADRFVDRDRERDAHVAARARIDLAVDADHFAAHVDQRTARVAGVDRHVGLDRTAASSPVSRCLALHDAGGHGVLEPNGEPMAITHSPTRSLEMSPTFTAGRPVASILTTRDVGALVGADQLGLELALVGQGHQHLGGILDHVRIGHDVAVGRQDETRAHAARAFFFLGLLRAGWGEGPGASVPGKRLSEEALEELLHLLVHLAAAAAALGHLLDGADLDDRRDRPRSTRSVKSGRRGGACACGRARPAGSANRRPNQRQRRMRRRQERSLCPSILNIIGFLSKSTSCGSKQQ